MKISNLEKSGSGTTLLETLMAVMVIAIIGATLIGGFAYGFQSVQNVRENQKATQFILEKVETLRLYTWDQLNTPSFVNAPTEIIEGIQYNWTVTITNAPWAVNYSNALRHVIFTVSWTGPNRVTRTRSLDTLVAKDGIQNYVY